LGQHQDLHVTLTILIGVVLGCAALYWSARSAPSASQTQIGSPVIAEPPVVHAADSATAPTAQLSAQAESVSDLRPAATTKPPDTPNYEGSELPIVFAFSERSAYVAEENEAGNLVNVSKRLKEGIITNSSDKSLSIAAIEVNLPTQETSQIQLVLSAGAQKHFGTEQGLKMISGDQLTLRSASYRDSIQLIP
jgi:hypothetical protein